MVPFPKHYGPDGLPVDRGLRQRVMYGSAQREAVLAWLVAGAVAWYGAGRNLPPEPEALRDATFEWRASSDLLVSFLSERCVVADPEAFESTALLHEDFNLWLPSGSARWSQRTFAERFGGHSVISRSGVKAAVKRIGPKAKPKQVRGFKGVRLKTREELAESDSVTDVTDASDCPHEEEIWELTENPSQPSHSTRFVFIEAPREGDDRTQSEDNRAPGT